MPLLAQLPQEFAPDRKKKDIGIISAILNLTKLAILLLTGLWETPVWVQPWDTGDKCREIKMVRFSSCHMRGCSILTDACSLEGR